MATEKTVSTTQDTSQESSEIQARAGATKFVEEYAKTDNHRRYMLRRVKSLTPKTIPAFLDEFAPTEAKRKAMEKDLSEFVKE